MIDSTTIDTDINSATTTDNYYDVAAAVNGSTTHDQVDFGCASTTSFFRIFLSSHSHRIQILFSSNLTTIWILDDSADDNIDYDTSIVMLL